MSNTPRAICELCGKEFDTKDLAKFKGFSLLCKECLSNEIKALTQMRQDIIVAVPPSFTSQVEDSQDNTSQDNTIPPQSLVKENLIITTRDEFWNAENTQLDLVKGTPFQKYQKIAERLAYWQSILFESQQSIAADYIRLQSLKLELTNEERKALKITYTDYNPGELNPANVKPTVARKPRESAADKAARTIAESLYKKQIVNGEALDAKSFAEHPEKWDNGFIRKEYAEERMLSFKNNNAMTLEQAIVKSQELVRVTKQQHFDSIGGKDTPS